MGKYYKKILIAVDGSESSMHALKESIKLANNEQSWITVLSVIPTYEGDLGATWLTNVKEAMAKPCRIALLEAEKLAKDEKVLIKTVCEEGEIYERIVDLADAENCDLIVMGRKGISGLEKVLVGSVTARVIGHTQRDVLVVPKSTAIECKSVLFATDGSKYSEAATNRAIGFAKSYGSEFKVISVVDVTEEFMARAPGALEDLVKKAKDVVEDVKKKASSEGVKAEGIVREGEAYKVITDTASREKAGIIVVGSHGRTGLRRLLMGSVTEKVIGYAPCPVLVVKP
ncbi:MAG TPA: universal stress protein [Thermodesulfovibrionales bacterium]|nr:universal stress protein [Thermodesulfovibrionales bacterium]